MLRCAIILSPACKRVIPQHDPNSPHAIVRRQACRNPIDISWKPKAAKPQPVPAESRAIAKAKVMCFGLRLLRSCFAQYQRSGKKVRYRREPEKLACRHIIGVASPSLKISRSQGHQPQTPTILFYQVFCTFGTAESQNRFAAQYQRNLGSCFVDH